MLELTGEFPPNAAEPGSDHPVSDAEAPPDGVEQSLELLQQERCACMMQLKTLFADDQASPAQIELYIHRIEAINGIMLSLARVTAVGEGPESPSLD